MIETFPRDHLTIVVLTNTSSAGAATIAGDIARSAFGLAPQPLHGSDVPPDEAAALIGRYDSDEGPIDSYACGRQLCFRPPDATQGQAAVRRGPFVYDVGDDTDVRFIHPPPPVEWGVVYTGGLFSDAKRRVHH